MTYSSRPAGASSNKRSTSVLLAILAVMIALGAIRWLQYRRVPAPATVTLTVTGGQVRVTRADAGEGSPLKAGDSTTLQRGDQVETGKGAQARLTFSGGDTTDLGGEARLTILELQESAWSRALEVVLALHEGTASTRIQHQLLRGARFEVETNVATVQARGTAFQCDVLGKDHVYVAVSEGVATVFMGEQSVELQAGQAVHVRLGRPLTPETLPQPPPQGQATLAPTAPGGTPTLTELEKTLFPPVITPTRPGDDTRLYTVCEGDTLYSIARKFGVSWKAIWEANRDVLQSPELIRAGQDLRIP